MLKICFITFGCKLNQAESLSWQEKFSYRGIKMVNEKQKSDLIIINACAVTAKAERELRQKINRMKRINSQAKIIITGCYLSKNKLVDRSVSREKLLGLALKSTGITKIIPPSSAPPMRTRALVKIQDGCNNFCAYCIVPFLRGRLKSKSVKNTIQEINQREEQGYQEVVLVGTDLQKFGDKKQNLVYLLRQILEQTNIPRIRLSSLWPTAINQSLIGLLKSNLRLCPHFHLSMQSGSDKILREMGRHYTAQNVLQLIKKMRVIPNLSLTADLIVGFPGETNKDFKQTIRFVQAAKLLKIHIFKYSPRPRTRAAEMANQISEATKKQRSQELAKIGLEVSEKLKRKYLNKTIQVLVENKRDHLWPGLTRNYLRVYIKSAKDLKNQLIMARLIKLRPDGFYGKIIN
ncbi:MAG: MiaB/RimO family radical SAM methylthiotransferase [Candidatus Parcubacteria bacterium]|nr:MiaB/RimO family radical SAM methylthiotransferase [Candidatus Parcubacteria bacterium]